MDPKPTPKQLKRQQLLIENTYYARENPEVLAAFFAEQPRSAQGFMQTLFLGAMQASQGIISPTTLALKIDNAWNEAVVRFAEFETADVLEGKFKKGDGDA